MSSKNFDQIMADKKYRALKQEERRLFDLLTEAGQKKRRFEELEREYQAALNGVVQDAAELEANLEMTPDEIEERLHNYQEKVNSLNDGIKEIRDDIRKNRLRRSIGEYGEEEFERRRERLRGQVMDKILERRWLETGMALARKVKAHRERIADSDEPAVEEELKPADRATDRREKSFSGDETTFLPPELIGSDPDRLTTPALHIKSSGAWERHPLITAEVSIGNIRNPENDIALYDPQVSRRHAKVIRDSVTHDWYFVDTGSTNGSLVNGLKVEAKNPVRLDNRDAIDLGDTRIVIYIP